jgi:hypothetical protein
MNLLFLSPHFPPQMHLFCAALRRHGAKVLGVGAASPAELAPELASALDAYAHVPGMEDYDELYRATAWLVSQHGRLDAVESHNEHWLAREAQLREDFNVPGPRPAELVTWQSKAQMARRFADGGIAHPPGIGVRSFAEALPFVRQQGYPLVVKPDIGMAARGARRVDDEAALRAALDSEPIDWMVQQYVPGPMVSFDGLTDRDGRIVYVTAHENSDGVMQIAQGRLDLVYCSLREVPAPMAELGARAVAAFGLRARFFHFEMLRRPDGQHIALEMNVRPPGGFTTDMMNFGSDVDVYDLWARVLTGEDLSSFRYERRYYCAHVSRRHGRAYRHSHDDIRELLGDMLVMEREMPEVLSLMGDHVYLVRHPERATVEEAARFIQELES